MRLRCFQLKTISQLATVILYKVSAHFNKPFYKGHFRIFLKKSLIQTVLTLNCNIQLKIVLHLADVKTTYCAKFQLILFNSHKVFADYS